MYPLLTALDTACSALPVAVRLTLYGLLWGVVAMLIYWRLSPQRLLKALKTQIAESQRALRAYKGTELQEILRLSARTVGPACQQFALVLGPTLIAMAPVLVVIAWLESTYSYALPAPGDRVTVTTSITSFSSLKWEPPGVVQQAAPDGKFIIRWPAIGEGVMLFDGSADTPILRLPLQSPVHAVAHPHWWNVILAGRDRIELPANAIVSRIEFDFPERRLWSLGPNWLRMWQTPFFGGLTVAALGMKFAFKIK